MSTVKRWENLFIEYKEEKLEDEKLIGLMA